MFEKPSRGPAVDPEVENRRKRKCDELKKVDEYYYVRKGCNFCKRWNPPATPPILNRNAKAGIAYKRKSQSLKT
ncbi:hypothetical protein MTO96_040688 [Rhipicephalus appendiculatus]